MNAEQALDEMGLAAYLLAEAERNERSAKNLRMAAGKKIAAVHAYFRAGVEQAKETTNLRKTNLRKTI